MIDNGGFAVFAFVAIVILNLVTIDLPSAARALRRWLKH